MRGVCMYKSDNKQSEGKEHSKTTIEKITSNAWVVLFFNICSLFGLILSCVFGNQWCILVFSILLAVLICIISSYLMYRVFAVRRAKRNIEKTHLAIRKETGELFHRFFHDLRDCNSFLDKNRDVNQEVFKDKATLLCNQIEKIFNRMLDAKTAVCIKLFRTDTILDKDIDEWEIQTFVRSSSTSDERYQYDRKSDKIIENTDFEIILRDVGKAKQKDFFYAVNIKKYIDYFEKESGEKFRNSHENYQYNSAIVVPIRIKASNMHPELKKLCTDKDYFHVVGFLCIDTEETFDDVKHNYKYSQFMSSLKYACAISDSMYHFFESYLIKEISMK